MRGNFHLASEIDTTGMTGTNSAAPPLQLPGATSSSHFDATRDSSLQLQTSPLQSSQVETPLRPEQESGGRRTAIVAFLISTIVHTTLLILLALYTLAVVVPVRLQIKAAQGPPVEDVVLEQAAPMDAQSMTDMPSLAERPETVTIAVAEPTQIQSPISEVAQSDRVPSAVGLKQAVVGASSNVASRLQLPSGGGLGGRTPEGRSRLGQQFGATAASEQAVENALTWLANHQRRDGSWSFNLELEPCNGRCGNSRNAGETPTPATGATGLALLAFMGAGYTQHEGKYDTVIRDGLYYLRSAGAESEYGIDWQQGSMYGHGIALLAVAESLSMSRREGFEEGDSDLRDLTTRGMNFTVRAQHEPSGSWGYGPGQPGDTTITGWQVLSLIATRRNKIPLPYYTLRNAHRFLLKMAREGTYEFGYRSPSPEPTMTAIGVTMMLYLGHSPYEIAMQNALDGIAARGPLPNNLYHNYYATLALHHSRHHGWNAWNTRLRDGLVATQATNGHEAGSWHFKDRYGDQGGRLYSTAMAAMILEVYYRYMPLYGEVEQFPL
ncbi:hypothetical protein CA13_04250 [Planctomycetes bacterium CA13]|uniref:Squalene cyclase C-terminal domain-containing protein n=1 Tax=Novipirellula herctigrandis TaxID=2527986 RepID=A0A5C5YVI1_9BACT|nr:hypothetical protein CA13_04250 [Planctomycetes bacterium CA13]